MLERFDFDNTQEPVNSPKITYFIRDECFYAFKTLTHTHNSAEFVFIISGTGNVVIENHSYPLSENTFYMVNPFTSHGEFLHKGQGFTYYIIGVENFAYIPVEGETYPPTVPHKLPEKSFIAELLDRIYKELLSGSPFSSDAARAYFDLLLIELKRKYKGTATKNDSKYSTAVGEVKHYIDSHLYGNISPYFISDHFGFVHNTLSKKFKKEVGISIQEYILQQRIEQSKKYIEMSNDGISKIAVFAGFDNPAYFSHYFKKIVGMSPTEYRNSVKNKSL